MRKLELIENYDYSDWEIESHHFFKQADSPFFLLFLIKDDNKELGLYQIKPHAPNAQVAEVGLYFKPEYRSKVFSRNLLKQIYSEVFIKQGYSGMLAETDNPLMAEVFRRENFIKLEGDYWIQLPDRIRYKI